MQAVFEFYNLYLQFLLNLTLSLFLMIFIVIFKARKFQMHQ